MDVPVSVCLDVWWSNSPISPSPSPLTHSMLARMAYSAGATWPHGPAWHNASAFRTFTPPLMSLNPERTITELFITI